MGTLSAGIKEIFATAKTTGSNVMLCGNDGTPDGHITMANLASVLGVAEIIASGDLRNVAGSPTPYYGTIVLYKAAYYPVWLCYGQSPHATWYGISGHNDYDLTNVTWMRIDNFGCNTTEALASLLGDKYVTTIRQTAAGERFKITRIKGATALVSMAMGGNKQSVYLISFNDSDSVFEQSVKLLFNRSAETISWSEDAQGNLYFTSQYGNSRGHSVIGLTGQVFSVVSDSTSTATAVTVIDTTYIDSYNSLPSLASALGVNMTNAKIYAINNASAIALEGSVAWDGNGIIIEVFNKVNSLWYQKFVIGANASDLNSCINRIQYNQIRGNNTSHVYYSGNANAARIVIQAGELAVFKITCGSGINLVENTDTTGMTEKTFA